jgi:hypothetical protein
MHMCLDTTRWENIQNTWTKRYHIFYYDSSLGLTTNAMAWKGVGQECNLGVTLTLSRMQKSMREWAHTLPSGLPLWETESLWTPEFSKNNLKGQNSLNWKVLYTMGKLLKLKCLKWVLIIHFNTHNTDYGRKKGRESKCQFDSRPLKIGNRLELHVRRCVPHIVGKLLTRTTTLFWDLISIGSLHKKLCAS